MAGVFQISCVNHKLEFLMKLQDHIYAVVADYINEMVTAGKFWIESKGNQETFSKIQQKIDNAVDFLNRKCQEISDHTEMRSSAESESQESQTLLKSDSGLETSSEVADASQQRFIAKSGQDKDSLHQVSTRFEVNEEAVCSIRNNLEKVTEKQTDVDKRFEDVTAMLKNMQEQLNDLCIADKQQKNRLKEHTDKIAEKEAEIQKQESKLHSLEKQLKKLSTKQNKLKEESLSNNNAYEELDRRIQDMCEDTGCQFSAVNARLAVTDSSVQDLLSKVGSQELAIQSLCTKVDTNMETFETGSNRRERNAEMLRQFENRIQETETNVRKELQEIETRVRKELQETETRVRKEQKKMGGQFQETESSFKNVCQLLTKRLQPLEQLRDVLNQRAKARNDNIKKLQEIVKEVAIMSPKLTQLENHLRIPAVGFTARVQYYPPQDMRFTYDKYDVGYNSGSFDCEAGIFTVPVTGTYFISIMVARLEKKKLGGIRVSARLKRYSYNDGRNDHYLFCVKASNEELVSSTKFSLARLEAGDEVSTVIAMYNCDIYFNEITFSCFMIK